MNPSGQRMEFELQGDRFFREIRCGDSVLFTENNYDSGIQNGTLGTLISSAATEKSFGVVSRNQWSSAIASHFTKHKGRNFRV